MSKKRTKAQKAADAKRPGRPSLPAKELRSVIVRTRLTQAEAKRVQKAADDVGKDVGTYIRDRILKGLK